MIIAINETFLIKSHWNVRSILRWYRTIALPTRGNNNRGKEAASIFGYTRPRYRTSKGPINRVRKNRLYASFEYSYCR